METKASAKEIYELQEKCGKHAEERFERWKKEGHSLDLSNTVTTVSDMANHYNIKLNKCFILVTSRFYNTIKGKSVSASYIVLFDVNENKEYGFVIHLYDAEAPNRCEVLSKKCNSEYEWALLISPFMEE